MSQLTLTNRTVPYSLYGMLMSHCKVATGQDRRDAAGRLLMTIDKRCPKVGEDGKSVNVWAWTTAGLASGWLMDNQPGQAEYEAWAKIVWGKRKTGRTPKPVKAALKATLQAMLRDLEE